MAKTISLILVMALVFIVRADIFYETLYTNSTFTITNSNNSQPFAIRLSNTLAEIDYELFMSNLAKHVGHTVSIVNNPARTPVSLISTAFGNDMYKIYWYGQRLILYGGSVTVDVNNSIASATQALVKINGDFSYKVDPSYLIISYNTYAPANPYNDAPGLRIGHISSLLQTNPLMVLSGFNNSTQDALLVVWDTPYRSFSAVGTNYTAFPASVIHYHGTNYKTIARGLAGFGGTGFDTAHIVVVTNKCDNVNLSTYFNLSGANRIRPWWVYYKGRDFMAFTNQLPVYTHYTGKDVINYMGQ